MAEVAIAEFSAVIMRGEIRGLGHARHMGSIFQAPAQVLRGSTLEDLDRSVT